MDRKEFIAQAGKGAAFALFAGCLFACKKEKKEETGPTPSLDVDFTIDLNDPANGDLQDSNIGYKVFSGNIIIAKTTSGSYIAATNICTHQKNPAITFLPTNSSGSAMNQFLCMEHQATFDANGKGLPGPDNLVLGTTLKTYHTSLNNNKLRIYS